MLSGDDQESHPNYMLLIYTKILMYIGEWMRNDPGQNPDASCLPSEGTKAVFCWWALSFLLSVVILLWRKWAVTWLTCIFNWGGKQEAGWVYFFVRVTGEGK